MLIDHRQQPGHEGRGAKNLCGKNLDDAEHLREGLQVEMREKFLAGFAVEAIRAVIFIIVQIISARRRQRADQLVFGTGRIHRPAAFQRQGRRGHPRQQNRAAADHSSCHRHLHKPFCCKQGQMKRRRPDPISVERTPYPGNVRCRIAENRTAVRG
jgi:hypothetical protein